MHPNDDDTRRMTENVALKAAEDRLIALNTKLQADSTGLRPITTAEVDELVDLLGMLGMTRTGEVPERFRNQTRH
jgi:hypothetical protein